MSALGGAVRGIVGKSVVPDFWRSVQGSVNTREPPGKEFSLKEVSELMLLWVRGAIRLRRDQDLRHNVLGRPKQASLPFRDAGAKEVNRTELDLPTKTEDC